MEEERVIKEKIAVLEDEHRSLDRRISDCVVNMLEAQRLKRQKLMLKDQIARLHSMLLPDIIA